jgi:hypothetical protein
VPVPDAGSAFALPFGIVLLAELGDTSQVMALAVVLALPTAAIQVDQGLRRHDVRAVPAILVAQGP